MEENVNNALGIKKEAPGQLKKGNKATSELLREKTESMDMTIMIVNMILVIISIIGAIFYYATFDGEPVIAIAFVLIVFLGIYFYNSLWNVRKEYYKVQAEILDTLKEIKNK